ncbi:MAG: sugar ABC transporter permease, partial [Thermotogaceae bacterium]|nr:sugar ABC transporter permease [Thermotogaceae bacterium]
MVYSKTVAWLLILPTLIFLAVFLGYPLYSAFALAFSGDTSAFDTFKELFHSTMFWRALKYTLLLGAV